MKLHSKISALVVVAAATVWVQQATPRTESLPSTGEAEVQIGHAIHADNPQVPKKFRGKWVAAVLGATLKRDGSFADLTKLAGEEDFEDVAIAAVRQWSYTPATLNGVPVETRVFVTISSNNKHMRTAIELDRTFPVTPRLPVDDLLGRGELFRVKPGEVNPPRAIYSPNPEYSEAARAAKYQGAAVLTAIVGRDGQIEDLWVAKRLGLGLEQKGLEAVRNWKFEPATKDGQPVPVLINIEVFFRLY